MAHVKIYGRRDVWQDRRGSVSDAVHRASSGPGACPQDKRFHRFLLLDADDLVAPRSKEYLVVEILCFTGRSREARRALIAAFYDDVAPTLGISADDLEVIIIESPPENWGIRGGLRRRAVADLPRRRLNRRAAPPSARAALLHLRQPEVRRHEPAARPADRADSRSATPSFR